MSPSESPDITTIVRLTADSMRAHAHPVRIRILGYLRTKGPATATTLAREFGLNSGATSYHLRQLATHHFIEEAAELGKGRERWWRASHSSTLFDSETVSGDAGESFLRAIAQVHFEQMQRGLDQHVTMPAPWQNMLTMSDWMLSLTSEEATRLTQELAEVLQRYPKHKPIDDASHSPDAIPVAVQYQILPQVRLERSAGG